jgi:Sigma-70 region 2
MEITVIDEETFPALHEAYATKLRRYFYRHGIPLSDIPDCCQDAWLTMWSYRSKFDATKGDLRTYVFLQARAALSWYWRRHASQLKYLGRAVPVESDDVPIEDFLEGHETPAHVPTQDERGWPWPIKRMTKQTPFCKNGHEMSIHGYFIRSNPHRRLCRLCKKAAGQRAKDKRRQLFESCFKQVMKKD